MNKHDEHKGAASEGSKSLNSATGKTEDVIGKRKRKLPLNCNSLLSLRTH
jgi:hypothetical protein